MPQMAPLSWSLLFCSFLALYLLNTSKIYFMETPALKTNSSTNLSEAKNLSWKW